MGCNVLNLMNTLHKVNFFIALLGVLPTVSVWNKLRGMAIPESSASFLLQATGKKTIKGFSHSDSSAPCATSSEISSLQAVPAMSYLVPHQLHPGWVTWPFAGMFPPCQPAMAQALLSTEHSQIHKQLSACDTTSSLWEQITQCVCLKWDSSSVPAHASTEPSGSDTQVGWCSGICAQTAALLLSGMFLSPLQISQVGPRPP